MSAPPQPSVYEQSEIRRLAAWRRGRDVRGAEAFARAADELIDGLIDRALTSRIASSALERTVGRALEDLSRRALASFRPDKALSRFPVPPRTLDEVEAAGLRQIDTAIEANVDQSLLAAGAQGAAAGALGPWGLPIDLGALFVLSARGVAAIATCCGFDVSRPAERRAVLEVMATPPRPWRTRAVPSALPPAALGPRVPLSVTRNLALKEARRLAATGVVDVGMQATARALFARLAASRFVGSLPLAGAAAGALVNVRFMSGLLEEARMTYRQRYLVRRYGRAALEPNASPPPAPLTILSGVRDARSA